MIELSKHIEVLLLKHNCVIVPQLGGFIAQDVPARYVAEENIFLPPHRTVAFNPQLTLNDGLLVQSYMKVYDTNYPETVKLIDQAVSNLKSEIEEHGVYELNGIGKITTNIDGTYVFEPLEAGIISPSMYGLDAVVVSKKENPSKDASHTEQKQDKSAKTNRNYTFSINKELVNYVAAAVVSIFFYFIWATPLTDSTSLNPQQASILFPHTVQYAKEEIPICVPMDSLSAAESIADKAISEKIQDEALALEDAPYTIVLASCIPEKNAETFVEKLTKDGYKEVSVLKKRNLIRVVHGHYATEKEAYEELHQIRKQDTQFKDAWILNTH